MLNGYDASLFCSPRTKLLIQGALRSRVGTPRTREAATVDDLMQVSAYLKVSGIPDHDRAMLWSALTIAFHGLLRVSEYAQSRVGRVLEFRDVTLTAEDIRIHLVTSKTSQFGKGQDVCIRRTNSPTCPYTALSSYLSWRGRTDGPLFAFKSGTTLKADDVNSLLRVALPDRKISSHSLRIGAATLAAKHNIPEYQLKQAGRWQSSAYMCYVRPSLSDRALSANLFC